jgi:hypothetical protein
MRILEWGIAPVFLTSALGQGEWSASRPAYFISRETAPGNPAGSPEPVWTMWGSERSLSPTGNETPAAQPAVRRYTD